MEINKNADSKILQWLENPQHLSENTASVIQFFDWIEEHQEWSSQNHPFLERSLFKIEIKENVLAQRLENIIGQIWSSEFDSLETSYRKADAENFLKLCEQIGTKSPNILHYFLSRRDIFEVFPPKAIAGKLLQMFAAQDNQLFALWGQPLLQKFPDFFLEHKNALHLACMEENPQAMVRLWQICPAGQKDELFSSVGGENPLHIAARNANPQVLKNAINLLGDAAYTILLEENKKGHTVLQTAVLLNHAAYIPIIFMAVPDQAEMDLALLRKNSLGISALQYAVSEGHATAIHALAIACGPGLHEQMMVEEGESIVKFALRNNPNMVPEILQATKVPGSLLIDKESAGLIGQDAKSFFDDMPAGEAPWLDLRLAELAESTEKAYERLHLGILHGGKSINWWRDEVKDRAAILKLLYSPQNVGKAIELLQAYPRVYLLLPEDAIGDLFQKIAASNDYQGQLNTRFPDANAEHRLGFEADLSGSLHGLKTLFGMSDNEQRKGRILAVLERLGQLPRMVAAYAATKPEHLTTLAALFEHVFVRCPEKTIQNCAELSYSIIPRLPISNFQSLYFSIIQSAPEPKEKRIIALLAAANAEQRRQYFTDFPFVLGKSSSVFISFYPDEKYAELAMLRSSAGNTLLHEIAALPLSASRIERIMQHFTPEEINSMFIPNNQGENPFHSAVSQENLAYFTLLLKVRENTLVADLLLDNNENSSPIEKLVEIIPLGLLPDFLIGIPQAVWEAGAGEFCGHAEDQETFDLVAKFCPEDCQIQFALYAYAYSNPINAYSAQNFLNNLMAGNRKQEFLDTIFKTEYSLKKDLVPFFAVYYYKDVREYISANPGLIDEDCAIILIACLPAESIKTTIANLDEGQKAEELSKPLEIPEGVFLNEAGEVIGQLVEQELLPKEALQTFYAEWVSKIPPGSGADLMQAKVRDFLDDISSLQFALFTTDNEIRPHLLKYAAYLHDMDLAMVAPNIPMEEFTPFIMQLNALNLALQFLEYATDEQRADFLKNGNVAERYFPDWKNKKTELGASLEALEKESDLNKTEEFTKRLSSFTKKPQVFQLILIEVRRFYRQLNAPEQEKETIEQLQEIYTTLQQFQTRLAALKSPETITKKIPEKFIDPISLEVMRDPVIIPSGKRKREEAGQEDGIHADAESPEVKRKRAVSDQEDGIRVDRESLEGYEEDEVFYVINPFTNQPIPENELIPDTILKESIKEAGFLDNDE